jgi:tRNA modification GTPase
MTTPRLEDAIAAIGTPPGRGALAMVRISGADAFQVLHALCPSLAGRNPPDRQQILLPIRSPETGEMLDRALVTGFVAPRSYTGEDSVEISCHGGVLTPQLILGAAYAAGARPALPGEFTRRAYLNGKIDLIQAEAVADLIDGTSPAFHRAAVHQMERGLSERLVELRSAILRAEALAAYAIDFPEEDEPPVPPDQVRGAAGEVLERIEQILRTAPEGELLRHGALVVFAGLPNSGKSSLFNALLGLDRSIVTDIPGTTRDAVEAEIVIEGFPFRLADTAGLRTTDDTVEKLGIEVARRYLAAADIVLLCSDARPGLTAPERQFLDGIAGQRTIVVHTKADLLESGAAFTPNTDHEVIVSARTGAGIPQLHRALLRLAFEHLSTHTADAPVVTRERHVRALRMAAEELRRFAAGVDSDLPLDLAVTHLRAAAGAVEEVIGVVTPDDVLGTLFGQFCVGK